MATYDDIPQEELDLAEMIATVVMEELETEMYELEWDLLNEGDDSIL